MKLLIERGLGSENPALKRLASGVQLPPWPPNHLPSVICSSFLIRYIESIFHKSMIFDIRNPLYPLRLISGRAQTRRAWRLPLNGLRWPTLEGAVQSRRASALSRQWPGRSVPRLIRILSITCHSKFPCSYPGLRRVRSSSRGNRRCKAITRQ
jgi:hypothetical protein